MQPFQLDSAPPSLPYREFARSEARFAMLERSDPARSEMLLGHAQDDVADRWRHYEQLTTIARSAPAHADLAVAIEPTDDEP